MLNRKARRQQKLRGETTQEREEREEQEDQARYNAESDARFLTHLTLKKRVDKFLLHICEKTVIMNHDKETRELVDQSREIILALNVGYDAMYNEMKHEVKQTTKALEIVDLLESELDKSKRQYNELKEKETNREIQYAKLRADHYLQLQQLKESNQTQQLTEKENIRLRDQLREAERTKQQTQKANQKAQKTLDYQERRITELELAEQRECSICLEQAQPCALGCGHTGCRSCLSQLKHCHLCRTEVQVIITLHLS